MLLLMATMKCTINCKLLEATHGENQGLLHVLAKTHRLDSFGQSPLNIPIPGSK